MFALFWLLGYHFSPRLADVGGMRFWRVDPDADYGPLNRISAHRVKTEWPLQNWEEMLRCVGSLKMGTVSASKLIRSLFRAGQPTTLGRAFREFGRLPKTLHMLRFVSEPPYRRGILTQLNHGESRHNVSRDVFHGRRGEIRQRYREGQEDQLGALGLVVNMLALWNTVYMQAALDHLTDAGMAPSPDDVARLSPLGHGNFNVLGRYSFELASEIRNGKLRPLRTPDSEPF